MHIEETDSATLNKLNQDKDITSFSFKEIETMDFDKVTKEKIMMWGIDVNLRMKKFRFNLAFDELNVRNFLLDFFNSKEVKNSTSQVHF